MDSLTRLWQSISDRADELKIKIEAKVPRAINKFFKSIFSYNPFFSFLPSSSFRIKNISESLPKEIKRDRSDKYSNAGKGYKMRKCPHPLPARACKSSPACLRRRYSKPEKTQSG